jgi:hypothetical protein
MEANERAALERLVKAAQGVTGQSGKVADFLLAWWNAEECGGFDLRSAWSCDPAICDDMATVFRYICKNSTYPDSQVVGMSPAFDGLVKRWRPHLFQESSEVVRTERPKLHSPRGTSAN